MQRAKRIHRIKGFGVHSPFAFNLITNVINEKYPYYYYRELQQIRDELRKEMPKNIRQWGANGKAVDELLFRLVNNQQPDNVTVVGAGNGLSALYMALAKREAHCILVNKVSANSIPISGNLFDRFKREAKFLVEKELNQPSRGNLGLPIKTDVVLFNQQRVNKELWQACVQRAHDNSLFIVTGIYESALMTNWWKSIVADQQTGITFDLYDLGLVFFDKTKIKQHYIVHF